MKVRVTKKDIRQGRHGDASGCPIACALKRLGMTDVLVGDLYIRANGKAYHPSLNAQKFIHDFDTWKPVKPSTFVFTKFKERP